MQICRCADADRPSAALSSVLERAASHKDQGDGSRHFLKVFLWALVMSPFHSRKVFSMGPCFVHGIQLICIGVQITGPYWVSTFGDVKIRFLNPGPWED